MTEFKDRASSREKDLVDLVVLATTHDVDGDAPNKAIFAEAGRRRMDLFDKFGVPSSWETVILNLPKRCPSALTIEPPSLRRP